MSVELFKVDKYPQTRKVLTFFKVTTKPKVLKHLKRLWKKSWNLKSSEEYEPCDWHFAAETDLFVVSTASYALLVMAKRFGHFNQPKIG